MSDLNILDNNLSEDLEITPEVRKALRKTFIWGKILGFTLYLTSGLMILIFLNLATTKTRSSAGGETFLAIAFFLMFIICTFLSAFHLIGFSNRGNLSLKSNSTKILSVSIEGLKDYFKYFGIFISVIALVFAAMIFLSILAFLGI